MLLSLPSFEVPPYRLSGVVYSALLNDPQQVLALGEAVTQAPYKSAPQHPVLALRPRNTLAGTGQPIAVPAEGVRTGASVGVVLGRTACHVTPAQALDHIAGYLLANDLMLPLAGSSAHYRPAVRQMARDGFCALGAVLPAAAVPDPDALAITLAIDGQTVWQGHSGGRFRNVARLLSEVSDFMTLQPGDVLLLGISADAPLALPGQTLTVSADGLGSLSNVLVAEAA
jgi:5-oxopent-3-ene-1,2,5-tricarboxylate decarboxylase / 2-hydroxyhepta-2,4-diene-1,7-dioate isomerase